jgi:hypothetical protein
MSAANQLFHGVIASGATYYLEVPVRGGALGAHIGWTEAVSSATITLEFSSNIEIAATIAGTAADWKDSGLSFTGPAASAAGALLINVENVRQTRARLKIVAAAVTVLRILDGTWTAPDAGAP